MKWTKGLGCIAVTFLMVVISSGSVLAEYSKVITFGADLSRAQRTELASEFGFNLARADIPVVDVTNAEERKYMQGVVSDELLGNKAISSAMVEMLPEGQGITVETRNITWVTTDMYINALATARVKDARVVVAAPFPVSGTAALTGIFKAVEHATGKSLEDEPKRIANEELVRTGELGQEIGKDKAVKLILLVKERVIRERPNTSEEIRQIIINVAGDLKISLTDRQIENIVVLMKKVNGLKLEVRDISGQLTDLKTKVENVVKRKPEMEGLLQRFLNMVNQLVERIRVMILGEG